MAYYFDGLSYRFSFLKPGTKRIDLEGNEVEDITVDERIYAKQSYRKYCGVVFFLTWEERDHRAARFGKPIPTPKEVEERKKLYQEEVKAKRKAHRAEIRKLKREQKVKEAELKKKEEEITKQRDEELIRKLAKEILAELQNAKLGGMLSKEQAKKKAIVTYKRRRSIFNGVKENA
jgi:hypothetical protein